MFMVRVSLTVRVVVNIGVLGTWLLITMRMRLEVECGETMLVEGYV